ncbi:MAG TPA: hypothetical protein VH619_18525 [Verrucomicrobiae bacterium]|jgi:hypothetical protein|nr:hypothetical protein [Verrucomicrobiae bacterium]
MATLCLVPFLAATAFSLAAAPLNIADVPPDPVLLFHLDCDALRQTYIGKYLLYEVSKPALHSNLVAFESLLSFDYRSQLHGVTVYSEGLSAVDKVAIIYADFVPDHVIALVKSGNAPGQTTVNNRVVYHWSTAGDPSPSYAIVRSNCMITGKSEKYVAAALSTDNEPSRKLSTGNDPFIQATAHNLDFLASQSYAGLFKFAKWAKLQAVETNEQLNAVLTVEAPDDYTAKQMSLVAQGMIAQLGLQKDHPQAASLATAFAVKQAGTTWTATLSVASQDLIAAIKSYTPKKPKPEP